ncbi:transcriptional regulator, HxlR family [Pseudoalteromonas denitrificans DSM 6059]|uniref:Transcriptional regulator, HxlR family n=2 Tax=Pseudoalteromonas TaxID=53246 RepID=A0A1I1UC39_9GAMM|nr:transcriptional regulator, HxlR family [Pseudoalteromonas denitrificans DSM 6059]
MALPIPGSPVRGSKTGKPIMALFDLLGRTWCLGIVWQLSFSDATFRELQKRCEDISPTLLNNRLKELMQLGFVEKRALGYGLTEQAQGLASLIKPMGDWSDKWAINYQNNKMEQE